MDRGINGISMYKVIGDLVKGGVFPSPAANLQLRGTYAI